MSEKSLFKPVKNYCKQVLKLCEIMFYVFFVLLSRVLLSPPPGDVYLFPCVLLPLCVLLGHHSSSVLCGCFLTSFLCGASLMAGNMVPLFRMLSAFFTVVYRCSRSKASILGGYSIGHSKQKIVYVHVSYCERFPR
jgi:predicted permease